MPRCPSPSELEAFAIAGGAYPAVQDHVGRCAECREKVEEIHANQDFIGTAGTVLAVARCGSAAGWLLAMKIKA